jgi:Lrp/AsnC family transcriptional regulator, leucine-responsive regulatory protein
VQEVIKMDQKDHKILQVLQNDGRATVQAVAEQVGLSASACLRRIQELERRKIITGYRAVISPVAQGVGFTAYVTVGLSDHTKEAQEAFERAIARAAEVRECHNVTGEFEYILRVEIADLAAYKYFHTEVLGTAPHVRAIQTFVVMDSPKDERA